MSGLVRDAPIGQLIRWLTNNRVLLYPEEMPDFELPQSYQIVRKETSKLPLSDSSTPMSRSTLDPKDGEKEGLEPAEPPQTSDQQRPAPSLDRARLERMDTAASELEPVERNPSDLEKATSRRSVRSATTTMSNLEAHRTRAELDEAYRLASHPRGPTAEIVPTLTHEGYILVDYYTTDDPENPQNFALGKKSVASLQIYLYTLAVYMGSAIYTPSVQGVMDEFGVGSVAASLGLALYVLAYGLGPLVFSPMSEIPAIGRNPPYMVTMGIFVGLSVAAPLVQNFAGLLVVRFLQGFFGSPCLATGGASLGDLFRSVSCPGPWAVETARR